MELSAHIVSMRQDCLKIGQEVGKTGHTPKQYIVGSERSGVRHKILPKLLPGLADHTILEVLSE